MEQVFKAVLDTNNIALILACAACLLCGWFHLTTRKEDRQERSIRDVQASAERAALYELVRQNTNALHDLRNTLSAINGKAF